MVRLDISGGVQPALVVAPAAQELTVNVRLREAFAIPDDVKIKLQLTEDDIARGGQGVIQKANLLVYDSSPEPQLQTVIAVAVKSKHIVVMGAAKENLHQFLNELPNCPNSILPLYGQTSSLDIYPYIETGDLQKYLPKICEGIRRHDESCFRLIFDLLENTLQALIFAHEQGIVHCDLKPANILIDYNGNMKLADWDAAKRFRQLLKPELNKQQISVYTSPEQILDNRQPEGSPARRINLTNAGGIDIWALGQILRQLLNLPELVPFAKSQFEHELDIAMSSRVLVRDRKTNPVLAELADTRLTDSLSKIPFNELRLLCHQMQSPLSNRPNATALLNAVQSARSRCGLSHFKIPRYNKFLCELLGVDMRSVAVAMPATVEPRKSGPPRFLGRTPKKQVRSSVDGRAITVSRVAGCLFASSQPHMLLIDGQSLKPLPPKSDTKSERSKYKHPCRHTRVR